MTDSPTANTQLQVSPEMAAYNEAWRVFSVIFKYDINAPHGDVVRLAFESAWNGAMNWVESRTLREIKNDK